MSCLHVHVSHWNFRHRLILFVFTEAPITKLAPASAQRIKRMSVVGSTMPPTPEVVSIVPKLSLATTNELELTEEEMDELKSDFDQVDTDRNGILLRGEVKTMLTSENCGIEPSNSQLDQMMAYLDCILVDGEITFEEYATALTCNTM